jgi:hypothetical protein
MCSWNGVMRTTSVFEFTQILDTLNISGLATLSKITGNRKNMSLCKSDQQMQTDGQLT